MKIIVMSDSHGDPAAVQRIIRSHPEADGFLHLGDGWEDFYNAEFRPNAFHFAVRGNCDRSPACDLPLTRTFTLEDVSFVMVHGHMQCAKSGTGGIAAFAEGENARVALFGHVHRAINRCDGEIQLICPGAVESEGSYAVLTVRDGQLECKFCRI